MKLYLRRQTLSATKGMLSKRTEISFSLYARLDLSPEERTLVEEYVLGGEVLGSHQGLIPGYKEVKADNMMEHYHHVAELVPGKDISCVSFVKMMALEQDLLSRSQTFARILAHAKEVRQNHEAVHDLPLAA